MKNLLFLAAGIVVAIVFCICASSIIEAVYCPQGFADELYNNNLYTPLALIVCGLSWAMAAVYYYVINSVKFDRWMHWLIVLMVNSILAVAACFTCLSSQMRSLNLDYSGECLAEGLVQAAVAAVMMVVASFAMRWWSSNCRHTPFPQ